MSKNTEFLKFSIHSPNGLRSMLIIYAEYYDEDLTLKVKNKNGFLGFY